MIPVLRELQGDFGASIEIISIDVDATEGEDMLRNFRIEKNITWAILRDINDVSFKYGVDAIPNFYLIGNDGIIRYHHIGTTNKSSLQREIEAAFRNDPITRDLL